MEVNLSHNTLMTVLTEGVIACLIVFFVRHCWRAGVMFLNTDSVIIRQ